MDKMLVMVSGDKMESERKSECKKSVTWSDGLNEEWRGGEWDGSRNGFHGKTNQNPFSIAV